VLDKTYGPDRDWRIVVYTGETVMAEMTQLSGYGRHAAEGRSSGNSSNGYSGKTVQTTAAPVELSVSLDWEARSSRGSVEREGPSPKPVSQAWNMAGCLQKSRSQRALKLFTSPRNDEHVSCIPGLGQEKQNKVPSPGWRNPAV
jgi:hypothetical protein